MAESAASALFSVIFQKLTDEAFKKYARSQNIYSELKQLGITLSQIQALLNDASQKEITHESVRLWLNSLQHLAYDIDDVLDDVATEAMHRELTPESEASTSMVRKLIPTCCTNFSLTSLTIRSCESMESISDLQLSNLTMLRIEGCESIESFPNLQLPNLIHLQLSKLTMLKYVSISKCPMIDGSFPRGIWPPNLSSLGVGGLKKPISEWGYQNFPASLVYLRLLCGEPDVRNFSQLSELLPSSLTTLYIEGFDNLESLSMGLQHLTSLQHLIICNCPKLINLPETLLPSLLSLLIYDSPQLKERCDGRGSHYWPQISHIPCIVIP